MAAKKKAIVSRAIVAKARKVLAFARERARKASDRFQLSNALYASDGMATITFPTAEERGAYFKTKEYDQIVDLIVGLPMPPTTGEVIEIRIPPSENGKRKKR